MRQLTTLKDEAAAQRFAAWLVTQKIEAHAEQDQDGWAIWVREEDHLPAAREQLAQFQAEPDHPRYKSAIQQAAALERQEQQRRERLQRNTIEVNRQWGAGGGTPRSRRLVFMMIIASIVVAIFTNFGNSNNELIGQLQFNGARAQGLVGPDGQLRTRIVPVWSSIQAGEVWRLVTPIFLHFGIMHLAFNMFMLFEFGGQIEHRIKTWRFLLLVLVIAVVSNVVQVVSDSIMRRPDFPFAGNHGGMSGVIYGLLGYLYVRTAFLNDRTFFLPSQTAFLAFLWLVGCIIWNFLPREWVGESAPHIANGAHVGGLLIGMALGLIPVPPK
jgi:GlpG protein